MRWMVLVIFIAACGCASPPGVEGLLLTVEQVIEDERNLIATDAERVTRALAQQRDSLEAAWEADLEQRETLDHDWLKRGVRVYVDARETLVRHEAELTADYETRRRNLQMADEALHRARLLLARQDGMFERVPDVRRWLRDEQERYQQEEGR